MSRRSKAIVILGLFFVLDLLLFAFPLGSFVVFLGAFFKFRPIVETIEAAYGARSEGNLE